MLCRQIKRKLKEIGTNDYYSLLENSDVWTERHYQLASDLVEVSQSSLRRIYQPENYAHNNFNKRTKEKFCAFLGYEIWDDLIQIIEEEIIEEEIQRRQYLSINS
ncbi:MAG: hypothetical protein EAZ55_08990 [Cytophagales bacterium]|nr:MAG: hypothetical protein EAZ55_08990 [Cytophagales bacterium]